MGEMTIKNERSDAVYTRGWGGVIWLRFVRESELAWCRLSDERRATFLFLFCATVPAQYKPVSYKRHQGFLIKAAHEGTGYDDQYRQNE